MLCFCIWEGPHSGSQKPPLLAMLTSLSEELKNLNAEGTVVFAKTRQFQTVIYSLEIQLILCRAEFQNQRQANRR